jgi:PBP1b-binding outer membrane lipoprotein LpoB
MKNPPRIIIALLAALALTLTGCGSSDYLDGMLGADTDNEITVEGESNTVTIQRGDVIHAPPVPVATPEPTPTPAPTEAGMGILGGIVLLSMLFSGCVNSPTTWAPNLTVGVNSGNQGSGTGIGTDEKTGVTMSPQVEREGGASVETSATIPSTP